MPSDAGQCGKESGHDDGSRTVQLKNVCHFEGVRHGASARAKRLADLDKYLGCQLAIAARAAAGVHHPLVDLVERDAAENPDDGTYL